jgi:hypothetical protein
VVTFASTGCKIAASWVDGRPTGLTHVLFPGRNLISLETERPSAEDYEMHAGHVGPGYLWPSGGESPLLLIGVAAANFATDRELLDNPLTVEAGRTYSLVGTQLVPSLGTVFHPALILCLCV